MGECICRNLGKDVHRADCPVVSEVIGRKLGVAEPFSDGDIDNGLVQLVLSAPVPDADAQCVRQFTLRVIATFERLQSERDRQAGLARELADRVKSLDRANEQLLKRAQRAELDESRRMRCGHCGWCRSCGEAAAASVGARWEPRAAEPTLLQQARHYVGHARGFDKRSASHAAAIENAVDAILEHLEQREADMSGPAQVPQGVHEQGWQWRPVDADTAFAPPFGTVRKCRGCDALVAGGVTACARCAEAAEPKVPQVTHSRVVELLDAMAREPKPPTVRVHRLTLHPGERANLSGDRFVENLGPHVIYIDSSGMVSVESPPDAQLDRKTDSPSCHDVLSVPDDELSELQKLCDAATPGPWVVDDEGDLRAVCAGYDESRGLMQLVRLYAPVALATERPEWESHPPDVAFVAAARDALPKLIARVRELEDPTLIAAARRNTICFACNAKREGLVCGDCRAPLVEGEDGVFHAR